MSLYDDKLRNKAHNKREQNVTEQSEGGGPRNGPFCEGMHVGLEGLEQIVSALRLLHLLRLQRRRHREELDRGVLRDPADQDQRVQSQVQMR